MYVAKEVSNNRKRLNIRNYKYTHKGITYIYKSYNIYIHQIVLGGE